MLPQLAQALGGARCELLRAVGSAAGHDAFTELQKELEGVLEDDVASAKNTFLNRQAYGQGGRSSGRGGRRSAGRSSEERRSCQAMYLDYVIWYSIPQRLFCVKLYASPSRELLVAQQPKGMSGTCKALAVTSQAGTTGLVTHPDADLPCRTQQCFAVKNAVDGFLDVARQTFCRVTEQAS